MAKKSITPNCKIKLSENKDNLLSNGKTSTLLDNFTEQIRQILIEEGYDLDSINIFIECNSNEKAKKILQIKYFIGDFLRGFQDSELLTLFYPQDLDDPKEAKIINQKRIDMINMVLSCLYKLKYRFKNKKLAYENYDEKTINMVNNFLNSLYNFFNLYRTKLFDIDIYFELESLSGDGENVHILTDESQFQEKITIENILQSFDTAFPKILRLNFWTDQSLSQKQKKYFEKIFYFLFKENPELGKEFMLLVYNKEVIKEVLFNKMISLFTQNQTELKQNFIQENPTINIDHLMTMEVQELFEMEENKVIEIFGKKEIKENFIGLKMSIEDLEEMKEGVGEAINYFIANFREKQL